MPYLGHIENGTVVLDEPAALPEGAIVHIVLANAPRAAKRQIDPMKYGNTVDWPVDGMAFQQKMRAQWK